MTNHTGWTRDEIRAYEKVRNAVEQLIDERVHAVSNGAEIWVEGIDEAAAALVDEYDLTERRRT